MKRNLAILTFMSTALMAFGGAVYSESPKDAPALELSDHVRDILKHEMMALVDAGRAIEKAIAEKDHALVKEQAAAMDKAFIMSNEVTTLDLRELEAVLGDDFVARDKEFHAMARSLEAAAKAKDSKGEQVIFGNMLRACAACHKAYAPAAPVLE